MPIYKYLSAFFLAVLLGACGGGGGSAGTPVAGSQPPIVVVPALTTDVPEGLTMAVGITQSFRITGGTAPYRATASNLQIAIASINGQSLTIGSIGSGASNILISDSDGKSVSVAVTVIAENTLALFTTAPATLTIAKDTERVYIVGGGQAGYTVETSDSRIAIPSLVGTSLVIRGVNIGSTTVILRDAKGATVSLAVTVGGQSPAGLFTAAPSTLTVAKDSTSSYSLGGGTPPYTVTSADTRIASVSSSPSSLAIFGVGIGSTQVIVRDSIGATLNIGVTVGGNSPAAFFTSAPITLAMAAGSTAGSFELRGGVQPYTSSSTDSRIAAALVNGNFFTITALKKGVATIQLVDATGKTIPVSVTVDGSSGGTGGSSAASIEILTSSGSLNTAPGSTVSFVVTVKDGLNTAVPAQEVVFSASSGTLTGANPTPVTNASGSISTVSLAPGADVSNRSITVVASVGSLSKSVVIPVVGTKLTVAGPGSALSGATNLLYSVTAVDSGGKPIPGAVLSVLSTRGNVVTPSTLMTDVSGAATFTFRPTISGIYTDTLRVSGLGTSTETSVAVSDENFGFVLPAAGAKLNVNENQTVQVRYVSGGLGQPNRDVTFSTTRGGIVGLTTVKTDGTGTATIQINSSTAGPVTISAQSGTARSSLTAAFVAKIPSTIVLQANPGAVPPNPAGGTVNQSSLSVIVRDASGNPVADRVVNFTAVKDGSNGSISPGTSTTDSNGSATVQFIPGALTTAANGVQIAATVQPTAADIPAIPTISSTAFLTVSGEALFISIGRANVIGVLDTVTYQKDFQVYVTDANGSPAGNRSIVMALEPVSYGKGVLSYVTFPDGTKLWVGGDTTSCANEDINFDGILQPAEDFNGSGRLEPGLPAVIAPGIVTTDSLGFGKFTVRFGKNFARWTRLQVKARSLVGGTESSASVVYDLEMVIDDAKSEGTPANVNSPFGTNLSCSSRF
jgi:hypothetical protein